MAAPVGNRFWEVRSSHGRNPIFESPEQMWKACCEYFDWVEKNPLWENKVTQYQGVPIDMPVAKMRAMTINGLCIFLDIARNTWDEYRKRDDFLGVVGQVESIIYEQKLTGAAADLLNPNIIARELGLKDESKRELTGPGGGPLEVKAITANLDPKEASKLYREMVKGGLPKP